jgi:hypothetical protein
MGEQPETEELALQIPFQYLARKDNPLMYRSCGFTDLSGDFPDRDQYERIIPKEGQLPEGSIREESEFEKVKRLSVELNAFFNGLQLPGKTTESVALRASFRQIKAAVRDALQDLQVQEALYIVTNIPNQSDAPAAVQQVIQEVLGIFNQYGYSLS